MRKIITIAATCLMTAATIPAYASSSNVSCGWATGGQQLSAQAAAAKAAKMGYKVRKVEREGGCLEVYAIGENGGRFEIYMHSVTGAIVKIKSKS